MLPARCRTNLIEKLEKCIESNGEENEINLLLDSMRFRLGATGKERVTAVNYFFKQILDICLPTHFRYFLHTAEAGEFVNLVCVSTHMPLPRLTTQFRTY